MQEVEEAVAFLTAEEAARLAGVARNTFYEWIAAGRVPYRKIGRAYRIPRAAFMTWLSGVEPAPTAQGVPSDVLGALAGLLAGDSLELTITVRRAS